MAHAKGQDTVDTTKRVTLNRLQCEGLTVGEYFLRYMIDSPADLATSIRFTVGKAASTGFSRQV